MIRHIKRVGSVAALFSLVALASHGALADILITNSGKQWEGTVTDEGTHYKLTFANGGSMTLPKSAVREVIRQELKRNPQVEEFLQTLRKDAVAVHRSVLAAIKRAEARHDREQKDSLKANEIAAAEYRLRWVSNMIGEMRKSGAGGVLASVQARRSPGDTEWHKTTNRVTLFREGPCAQVGSTLRLTEVGSTSRPPHDRPLLVCILVCTTRATADKVLREAEDALKQARQVPEGLIERQKRELREYYVARDLAKKTKVLVGEAATALATLQDKPELPTAEMAKWKKVVDESIVETSEALSKVQRRRP